jgi:histidine triad (HIT) family protein
MPEKDVFCKIVDGEIPCHKLYEDDEVLAFLDISQVTKGHALVITKKHFDNFLSTPSSLMHRVMSVAQRIGQVDIKILGAKGVNILTNCYEAAGQTVMHFHVHVIPRYDKEEGLVLEMKQNSDKELNLPVLAKTIGSELK